MAEKECKLKKAYFARLDNKKEPCVECLFNPKELNVETSNKYAEVNIPGLQSPIFQYVRGNSRSLTMDLFFDTYTTGEDVRTYTDVITGWNVGSPQKQKGFMDIDSKLHAPPVCLFMWGEFVFECIIERVRKQFTMFFSDGRPARATLNVTLKEYIKVEVQVKNIKFESSDLTKKRTIKEGDTLLLLAQSEYGDPKEWRLIADANNLDNTRTLIPGQEIFLPPKA